MTPEELLHVGAVFLAVAGASGWLTYRMLLRRRRGACGRACGGCERATRGDCAGGGDGSARSSAAAGDPDPDQNPDHDAKPPGRGIRPPGLQVVRGE